MSADLVAIEAALLGQPYVPENLSPRAASVVLPIVQRLVRERDHLSAEAEQLAGVVESLNQEMARMHAETADMQKSHAEALDHLLNQRDALAKRILALEEERDAWRRAANVAPVIQCGACGAALLPQPRDNQVYPCACGSTARITTLAAPFTALDIAALRAAAEELRRPRDASPLAVPCPTCDAPADERCHALPPRNIPDCDGNHDQVGRTLREPHPARVAAAKRNA